MKTVLDTWADLLARVGPTCFIMAIIFLLMHFSKPKTSPKRRRFLYLAGRCWVMTWTIGWAKALSTTWYWAIVGLGLMVISYLFGAWIMPSVYTLSRRGVSHEERDRPWRIVAIHETADRGISLRAQQGLQELHGYFDKTNVMWYGADPGVEEVTFPQLWRDELGQLQPGERLIVRSVHNPLGLRCL